MKKLNSLLLLFLITLSVVAKPFDKAAYYNSANGKCGEDLRLALSKIINNGTTLSYDDLWEAYSSTDLRSDGKIWDMYSNITNYNPIKDRAGSYKKEDDCYNREHSIPQSVFNKQSPMRTDLYHVYPTDGYVNNKRSSYCFGNVDKSVAYKYTSANNFSKLGTPTTELKKAGCNESLVFEPDDEYKGDFARTYFYFVTRYVNRMSSFKSYGMFTKDNLSEWATLLLRQWSTADVVSSKETNRIEAVYEQQHNRNPFIDYPGLEEYIWGSYQNIPFSATNYINPYDNTNNNNNSNEDNNNEDNDNNDNSEPQNPTPEPTPDITYDGDVYVKVTSVPTDWSGIYLIVYEAQKLALDGSMTDIDVKENGISVTTESDGTILVTDATKAAEFVFSHITNDTYSIKTVNKLYLGATKGKNSLNANTEPIANKISLTSKDKSINIECGGMLLRFNNSGQNRFRYYKKTSGGVHGITLYRKSTTNSTNNDNLNIETSVKPIQHSNVQPIVIYDLSGRRLQSITQHGIYIVNGKKVVY